MATINLQQQHGQYKRSIGYYVPTDGKAMGRRIEKVWWLGGDKETAQRVATALVGRWNQLKKNGGNVWKDEDVKSVIEFSGFVLDWKFADGGKWSYFASGAPREVEPGSDLEFYIDMAHANGYAMRKEPTGTSTVKLFDALDAYVKTRSADATLSRKYRQRAGEAVAAAKHYLMTLKAAEAMLATVDRVLLERLTNHVKGRPLSRKTKQPIEVNTVKTLLQHWRQAIDWIDSQADSDRFGKWEAPRRWKQLFDVELNSIRSKAERDAAADGPVQITLEEFRDLYKATTHEPHRMILLMGLFCAQGQTELAVTRRDEIDLANSQFTHRRNKTGQPGIYWMPPQLVKAIAAYWKANPKDAEGLAFRTAKGLPLVSDDANSDSVRQFFDDIREVAGTRKEITFYSLRRYFGHRNNQAGGVRLRDAALSHTGKTVGDISYSNHRDFDAVEKIGRKIYAELVKLKTFK